MTMNEKYNLLIGEFAKIGSECTKSEKFNLNYDDYKSIIDELELDGLLNRGSWCLSGGYHSRGLTFKGKCFIENSDSKKYDRIEKTEVYNYNIHIEGDNKGTAILGNKNTIIKSKF